MPLNWILHCECGWEKPYRNPVAARWGGESHLPFCSFYREAKVICMAYQIVCPHCRRLTTILNRFCLYCDGQILFDNANEWLADMKTEEETDEMLPTSGSGGTPKGKSRAGAMKFITNEMLSMQDQEATILGIKLDEENKFGARVILKLAFQGQTVFWGVNIKKNPNYQMMLEKFGPEENDWVNQKILLHLEKDDFTGNYFPTVAFGKAPVKK